MALPSNYTGRSPLYHIFPCSPVVDGTESGLPSAPLELIKQGRAANVSILVGANKADGSAFEPLIYSAIPGAPKIPHNQHDVDLSLNWLFDAEDAKRIMQTYPLSEFAFKSTNPYRTLVDRVLRDCLFQCGNRDMAEAWTRRGLSAFVYSFAFDLGPLDRIANLGDFHGIELPFVFENLDLVNWIPTRGDKRGMSLDMSCLWTSFAYSGFPNGGVEVTPGCEGVQVDLWPPFGSQRVFFSLNDEVGGRPKAVTLQADNKYPHDEYPSDKRCDMWMSVKYPWRDRNNTQL